MTDFMDRMAEGFRYADRRKLAMFVVFVLSFITFSFTQGTIVQQVMDLHLTNWPIIAVRNGFAVLGVLVGIGLARQHL